MAKAIRLEIRKKIKGKIRQQFFSKLIKSVSGSKINEKSRK